MNVCVCVGGGINKSRVRALTTTCLTDRKIWCLKLGKDSRFHTYSMMCRLLKLLTETAALSCYSHLLLRNKNTVFLCFFSLSPGGLSLWLILWLVVVKPGGVTACPRLCVCYPTPMTVSCQSQNLTIVPSGVPYNSQRVFLQNNRITELRADSFGFETQVRAVIGACRFPRFTSVKNPNCVCV